MSDTQAKKGPDPLYGEAMQRTNLMLPAHLKAYARDIGKGNMSEGVRDALEEHMRQRSNMNNG